MNDLQDNNVEAIFLTLIMVTLAPVIFLMIVSSLVLLIQWFFPIILTLGVAYAALQTSEMSNDNNDINGIYKSLLKDAYSRGVIDRQEAGQIARVHQQSNSIEDALKTAYMEDVINDEQFDELLDMHFGNGVNNRADTREGIGNRRKLFQTQTGKY